jgi:uncharacterized protein (DUF488 family)
MSGERIIYTIGHSNRTIEEFIDLLEENKIELLADVRTVPRSSHNPQFNKESLPKTLRLHEINYIHLASLGGLRGKGKNSTPSNNSAWENASFRNYADYAETEAFHAGLVELIQFARKSRTCYMCAEALWWRCHRRIITDYLLAFGWKVRHIMSPGKAEEAEMNENSLVNNDGRITYPAAQGSFDLW